MIVFHRSFNNDFRYWLFCLFRTWLGYRTYYFESLQYVVIQRIPPTNYSLIYFNPKEQSKKSDCVTIELIKHTYSSAFCSAEESTCKNSLKNPTVNALKTIADMDRLLKYPQFHYTSLLPNLKSTAIHTKVCKTTSALTGNKIQNRIKRLADFINQELPFSF